MILIKALIYAFGVMCLTFFSEISSHHQRTFYDDSVDGLTSMEATGECDTFFVKYIIAGLVGVHGFLALLVWIVSLNVMIAFIMETYTKISEDKNAVLTCIKASCMMEMYCLM